MQDRPIKTYGRVLSRGLSKRKQALMDHILPRVDALDHIQRVAAQFDKINLEIGFGSGENLVHQARLHPDILYIGAEPYINSFVKALSAIIGELNPVLEEESADAEETPLLLPNVLLHPADVRDIFEILKRCNIKFNEIFILYPDPWPKKRHHKKRLINNRFLAHLSEFMDKTSKLYISTDHADYAEWIEQVLDDADQFYIHDYNTERPLYDHIESKYEGRGVKRGHSLHYFTIGSSL